VHIKSLHIIIIIIITSFGSDICNYSKIYS